MKIRELGCFIDPSAQAGLVYFAQRLDEMTRNYTLDSFKAPTVSIPVLIKECIEQIKAIDSNPRGVGEASVAPIIDELRTRLVGDTVHRRMLKSSRDLQSALSGGNVKTLLPKLRVLRSEISERAYVSTCMEMLDDAIRSISKSNIEYLTREFVSVLQTMGVSRRHLHRTAVQHFFQGSPKSVDFDSLKGVSSRP